MAARGLLFDLDGTIWDSHGCYSKALHASGAGMPPHSALARLRTGENIISLAREMNISKARLRDSCKACSNEITVFPGVRETLGQLQKRGTALGIATNLPGWLIEPILTGLDLKGYFRHCVYAAAKPGGKRLRLGIKQLCVTRTGSIYYVGDTKGDAIAAARAGVLFAWAAYGYGLVQPPNTTTVLTHFSEILAL
jgi:phosphoglycolate phosphatase-like HAD superfamily hydrolase